MKNREIYEFSKTGFARLNTELNASETREDADRFADLNERTDRVNLFERDDTVAFALSSEERAKAKGLVDEKRRQFEDMLDRGQEANIFGNVREQKTETETALLDMTGSSFTDGRSPEARASDRGKDAEITGDAAEWAANKDQFDFPGIDTGPEFRNDPPKFL